MGVAFLARSPSRTYRLDRQTLGLMAAVATKLGISQSDVIRMGVRLVAAAQDVTYAPPPEAAANDEVPDDAGE